MRLLIVCVSLLLLLSALSSKANDVAAMIQSGADQQRRMPNNSIEASISLTATQVTLPEATATVPAATEPQVTPTQPAPVVVEEPEVPVELNLYENAEPFKKIVAAGVPEDAVRRLFDYLRKNIGAENVQETYSCIGKDPASERPCEEEKRVKTTKKITVKAHAYAAIMDFTLPSTEARLYFIHLQTGQVEKYLTTHGKGSGNAAYAYKFSNRKDSLQTSLGIFAAGGTYTGSYGTTLRMYGLETSNDQAYRRDIVLHPAWYVSRDFAQQKDPKTGRPYGRIGVSWGCPAVSFDIAKKIIPLLKNGGLILHYHKDLMERSLSGKEVSISNPNPEYIPLPTPRPDYPPKKEGDTEAPAKTGSPDESTAKTDGSNDSEPAPKK